MKMRAEQEKSVFENRISRAPENVYWKVGHILHSH